MPLHLKEPLNGYENQHEICLSHKHPTFQVTGLLGDTTLTPLEFFSLQLYVAGKPYKEIGNILDISDKMVEKHIRNIKVKLGYHPQDIAFVHERNGTIQLTLRKK